MKIKKNSKIFLVLFILLVSVIGYLFFSRNPNNNTLIPPILRNEQEISLDIVKDLPAIPKKHSRNPFSVVFNLEQNVDLPDKMKVYSGNITKMTQEEIIEISKKFGYAEEPLISGDENAKVYTFYSENSSLRIEDFSRTVDYKTYNISDLYLDTETKDENLTLIAKQFLEEKGVLQQYPSLELIEVNKLLIDNELVSNADKYNAVSLSFTPKLNDFKVYDSNITTGTVSVIINSQDEVYKVQYQDNLNYEEEGEVLIQSYNQIVESASTKLSLQSCKNGEIKPSDLDYSPILSVDVRSIELGYLQRMLNYKVSLQPILKLVANVSSEFDEDDTSCIFYLSPVLVNF